MYMYMLAVRGYCLRQHPTDILHDIVHIWCFRFQWILKLALLADTWIVCMCICVCVCVCICMCV